MNNNNNGLMPEDRKKYLQEVQQVAQFDNSELSREKVKTIVRLAGEGKIGEEHIETLAMFTPDFTKLAVNLVVASLPNLIDQAGKVSEQTISKLSGIHDVIEVLKILAEKAESDETRIKLGELTVTLTKEYNQIIRSINQDNNDCWWGMWGIITGASLAFTVMVFVKEQSRLYR